MMFRNQQRSATGSLKEDKRFFCFRPQMTPAEIQRYIVNDSKEYLTEGQGGQ